MLGGVNPRFEVIQTVGGINGDISRSQDRSGVNLRDDPVE
jgi:hypothetical protein